MTSPQAYLVLGSVFGRADFAAIPGECILSVHLYHLGTVILIVIYGLSSWEAVWTIMESRIFAIASSFSWPTN